MYHTILLAYDGTRPGREALQQGASLAFLCQARVHLLAVVAPELGIRLAEAVAPSNLPERESDEVKSILAEGADELRRAGLSVETRLAAGTPAEEIGKVAQDVRADLIVVGHRDQSAIARWWGGSVGASLLAHAPCSVLVAVAGHESAGIGKTALHAANARTANSDPDRDKQKDAYIALLQLQVDLGKMIKDFPGRYIPVERVMPIYNILNNVNKSLSDTLGRKD